MTSLTFVKQRVLNRLDNQINDYHKIIQEMESKLHPNKDGLSFMETLKDFLLLFSPFHSSALTTIMVENAEIELNNLIRLKRFIEESDDEFVSLDRKDYESIFLSSPEYYNTFIN
jgi:hypothetical protein